MPSRLRAAAATVVALLAAAATVLVPALPAAADVAPAYGAGATATRLSGLAFDACQAPSLDALRAWRAESPYRGVGIYTSGRNRLCDEQPLLTPSYITTAGRMGWRFIPIHVGRQAPCTTNGWAKISRYVPYSNGQAEADEAVEAVRALGMLSGTAIYLDIEHYDPSDAACARTVLRFVEGWVDRLHQRGFLAGVYSSGSSGVADLVEAYAEPGHSRPDAIWFAHWNKQPTVWNSPYVPEHMWRVYQRMHQYDANPDEETYGGYWINIDANAVHGIFASIRYRYTATSRSPLNVRRGPKTSEPVLRTIPPGAPVEVACQAPGQLVGSTKVWNRLSNGGWVTDAYVSTPSRTGYSYPVPRCSTPFQAMADVRRRTGPSLGNATVGILTQGSLAHVECQTYGQLVGDTRVWNRLVDGSWVTDDLLRSRSRTGFSFPAPRC